MFELCPAAGGCVGMAPAEEPEEKDEEADNAQAGDAGSDADAHLGACT